MGKKWLVTVEHLSTLCHSSNSNKALVYESTDVKNMRLVHARGIAGLEDPADLQATIERLKLDMSMAPSTDLAGPSTSNAPKTAAVVTHRDFPNLDDAASLAWKAAVADHEQSLRDLVNEVERAQAAIQA